MKSRTQHKFNQLIVIICSWTTLGLFISFYDHLLLNTQSSAGPTEGYSFLFALLRNMGAGFIGGILGGSFQVFYINEKYQDKPYLYTIFAVSGIFLMIVALVTIVMGLILVPLQTGLSLRDSNAQNELVKFLTDPYPIKSALVWSFIVGITQLLLQVSSKFGQGIFWNIVRGRYNTPREENRIFMFLDMNSSTTIAEKLGDEKYHALLKDFFADVTNPVLDNKGEIYQYVGDEVIVVWKQEEGIEKEHCLQCFFEIKEHLKKRESYYLKHYGLLPSFKAGFHCGTVVAGEVGIVKRDITYSGDVLNTTSRIQSLCKEFNSEIIASAELLNKLNPNNYNFRPLGAVHLKGKGKALDLCSIEEAA